MGYIYYQIWIDSIKRIQFYKIEKKDWKSSIFIMMSWIFGTNIWIIFVWLKFFGLISLTLPYFDFFIGTLINKFLTYAVVFVFPISTVNYFLIFHKNRYEKFLDLYPLKKNSIAFYYVMTVLILAFFTVVIIGSIQLNK
jgi:hypothetical protein